MSLYGKITAAFAAITILSCGSVYAADVEATAQAPDSGTGYYVLMEYGNSLALFEDGNAVPLAIYSTPLSQINPADALILHDGIRLKTMTEVARLLEDLDIE